MQAEIVSGMGEAFILSHKVAIAGASAIGVILLTGMLIGSGKLPDTINPDMTYRQAAIIIWTIGVPAWFVIEK